MPSFFIYSHTPEKQTPERHKKSGIKRPLLPFDGDWLMTEGVSSQLDQQMRRTVPFISSQVKSRMKIETR
ncbi:hypothetical protein CUU66_18635 [Peribacillus deserti]|uniref:Uncharacterized protein n=1 Tax=Peribacillus deserti TaxID=673318 RepID=A0A2N5M1M2_9BACI|nr:hypothetical protein CUU66_18635 [Peribacillus deserti]